MSLLDNLSKIAKTVGEGAANVAKKSGEVVEVAKINHDIKSQEGKIRDYYEQIGEKIYSNHTENQGLSQDVVELCEKINGANGEIEVLKGKILEVNSKQEEKAGGEQNVCSNCGAELAQGSAFCASCGNKVE